MNTKVFLDIIKNPSETAISSNTALLNEVTAEFPYFQTAHVLYLKSLQLNNSIHYSHYLKKATAYAGNRSLLYTFINKDLKTTEAKPTNPAIEKTFVNESPIETPVVSEEPKTESTTTETLEAKKENSTATIADTHTTLAEEKPEEVLVVAKFTVESKPEIELTTQAILNQAIANEGADSNKIEEKGGVVDIKKLSPIAKEIISNAVNASIKQEVEKEKFEDKTPESTDTKEETAKQENTPSVEEESGEHNFLYWLKQPKAKQKEEKLKSEYEDLIERFIKEEPKISKRSATFYSPVDKAKQSITEDFSFVTETLARIYFTQGAFDKALKAYQALSLKYPEKKHTFAAQIEEIRKHINDFKI
ncbi:MAG: hypothetical protein J0M08_12675 [Bacteroidetes bacterium]|nr:hypothetical protein [Bacteroidota bacterium]